MNNSNPNNPVPLPQPATESLCDLNWTEFPTYYQTNPDLIAVQRHLLTQLLLKEEYGMSSFAREYYRTGAFIVLANRPFAYDYVYCGRPNGVNPPGACHRHHWCQRCSNHQAYKLYQRFLLIPNSCPLHFLTITYEKNLPINLPGGEDIKTVFEAFAAAASQLVRSQSWNGVFLRHEVAVNQFLPMRLVVHAHAIVHADEITQMQLETLTEHVQNNLPESLLDVDFGMNYAARQLTGQRELYNALGYLHKPINFVGKYEEAWQDKVSRNPNRAAELNTDVTDFLQGVDLVLRDFPMQIRLGTFHTSNPGYIGLSPADREDRKDEIEEIVRHFRGPVDQNEGPTGVVDCYGNAYEDSEDS